MRTEEEKNRQIEGLKKMKEQLPEINFFGENNHKPIDASIEMLEGYAIYDDYSEEEYSIESMADKTKDWLEGDDDEDLFELND